MKRSKYHIACPYTSSDNCLNNYRNTAHGSKEYKENCVKCKMAWLNRKYETYPHEDGMYEKDDE